jgi:hypothetical protein
MLKILKWCLIGIAMSMVLTGLSACQKNQETQTLPSIVTNPPATPYNVVDLSKYILTEKEPDPDGAQFFSVSIGANDEMIGVNYTAPPKLAQTWIQGDIFVVNEKNGQVFRSTVIVPVVGWLFQRPVEAGQHATVMLVNNGLKEGDTVTVVLGKYKRLHYTIPKTNQ